MNSWLEIVVLVVSVLLLVPLLVLTIEVLAAFLPGRRGDATRPPGVRCAILVPAHDEEGGIAATVGTMTCQLRPDDRLLVVADNCTDRTAEVARSAGASVAERNDPSRRGKGYALDFGVRSLEQDPPEVVLIIDADCRVRHGTIDLLVEQAWRTGRPAQAVNLLDPAPDAGVQSQLSAFAFLFKNLVRPLGLCRLGFPSNVTGTGTAFPWTVLRQAKLASGNIVEDIQMGIDLACAGYPTMFCERARVDGVLPGERDAADKQRTRWEHGHLRSLLTLTPRLLLAGLRSGRLYLLVLALELSVPPLSLLVLLYLAGWLIWCIAPSQLAGAILAGGGLAFFLAVLAAWARFGRSCLPFTSLLAIPFYVVAKVPRFFAFLFRPQRAWIRTPRSPSLEGKVKDEG